VINNNSKRESMIDGAFLISMLVSRRGALAEFRYSGVTWGPS
jgi:hypothetical protein